LVEGHSDDRIESGATALAAAGMEVERLAAVRLLQAACPSCDGDALIGYRVTPVFWVSGRAAGGVTGDAVIGYRVTPVLWVSGRAAGCVTGDALIPRHARALGVVPGGRLWHRSGCRAGRPAVSPAKGGAMCNVRPLIFFLGGGIFRCSTSLCPLFL